MKNLRRLKDLIKNLAKEKDINATIKSYPVTFDSIKNILDSILAVQIDDGIDMKLINIKEIRAEDEYSGFRISMEALMDGARIPLKVDITTGDKITHKEVVYRFDLLLEDRSIEIELTTPLNNADQGGTFFI